MCDEESSDIGDLVSDDIFVYRGCGRKNDHSFGVANPIAFYKKGLIHKDGLSLTLGMVDSVKGFRKGNFGALRIRVGDIHALNRGLEVRYDLKDSSHVLIRNLPCIDRVYEKESAEKVAAELAFIAPVASANPIVISFEPA